MELDTAFACCACSLTLGMILEKAILMGHLRVWLDRLEARFPPRVEEADEADWWKERLDGNQG